MNKLIRTLPFMVLACLTLNVAAAENHYLADRHVARGVKCEGCHTSQPPKAVPSEQCISCHGGYDKLAKRTDKKDINPHDSHVENPACGDCHHGHRPPAFLCDQCHQFDNIKVP